MKRKLGIFVLFGVLSLMAKAQVNGFEEAYKAFRQQAIADYEKLSAQESYGNIFKKIINEEQSQLLFLLQLLGTLENRR